MTEVITEVILKTISASQATREQSNAFGAFDFFAVQLTTSDLFVFVVRRHVRMSCSRNPDREEYHWDRKE